MHGHELEGGQFKHSNVRLLHLSCLRQQRVADVAAEMDGVTLGLQQLCDDGGGRRLSVGTGDGDLFAGADIKEDLHLGGDDAPPLFRRFKGGDVRTDAGRAEDKVVVKAVQIMLSHLQLHAPLLQFGEQRLVLEFLSRRPVAGGNCHTVVGEQADEGRIGNADADNGNGFVFQ